MYIRTYVCCRYICIYIHTHTRTQIHTHTHTHTHAHTHTTAAIGIEAPTKKSFFTERVSDHLHLVVQSPNASLCELRVQRHLCV